MAGTFSHSIWTLACCFGLAALAVADGGDGDWCQTYERWAARHSPPEGGECPIQGTCDIPEVRDSWIPDPAKPIKTLRMRFIVFAEDDGSNPAATQAEVDAQLEHFNQDIVASRFQFVAETEFINSTEFRYYTFDEDLAMKTTYAETPESQLNVFIVQTSGFSFGTFAWDPNALTALGGIVMHDGHFGPTQSILTHEVGHNLGLWHTHHGVSEVPPCSACYERADGQDADTTGDFAGDTPPTPVNFMCGPPGGTDACSGVPWGETDFTNFMGYAPDACISHLTEHQKGRWQCWFDGVLIGWLRLPGDGDNDGDVDAFDFANLLECSTGPGGGVSSPCEPFDFDVDLDVDWHDAGAFQLSFTGNCSEIILEQPQDATVCLNASAIFEVLADGGDLSYQWRHDGAGIPGATDPTLVIEPVTPDSTGTYTVVVSSTCPTVVSDVAELAIFDPPTILDHPESLSVCLGESATFAVDASGAEPFSYQWQMNGEDLAGEDGSVLVIEECGLEDVGAYRCLVTDMCGQTTSTEEASLLIHNVEITKQPVGGTFCVAENIFLFVSATGGPSYQWFQNGRPIPDATDFFLSILDAAMEDSGAYHAVATNECNSVASDIASVDVICGGQCPPCGADAR